MVLVLVRLSTPNLHKEDVQLLQLYGNLSLSTIRSPLSFEGGDDMHPKMTLKVGGLAGLWASKTCYPPLQHEVTLFIID